ncbi:MAG: LytTR family DNA-binding domain-containing protein [Bacteroidota bacterium]|nr:LytTR family DNA-binding domain-containing protein [Bacteroidota bacterium]
MTLTCFLIDDEPLALGLLESYVAKTPFLHLTGKFTSAVRAVESIRETPPDVIFLDIQMGELNGMEFARLVPDKTRIIFTTAFEKYALQSYKVNALEYLLKPFGYPDFLQAANKALQWYQLNEKATTNLPKIAPDCIYVKSDYRLIQISLLQILYIEGLKDYLKIFLEGETQPVVSHITMKAMEEMLPAHLFMRVHRSFIVRKDKIKVVEHNRIIFGKTHIPISDSYKDSFQSFLDERTLI